MNQWSSSLSPLYRMLKPPPIRLTGQQPKKSSACLTTLCGGTPLETTTELPSYFRGLLNRLKPLQSMLLSKGFCSTSAGVLTNYHMIIRQQKQRWPSSWAACAQCGVWQLEPSKTAARRSVTGDFADPTRSSKEPSDSYTYAYTRTCIQVETTMTHRTTWKIRLD